MPRQNRRQVGSLAARPRERATKAERGAGSAAGGGPIERTEDWRSWKAILRQAQVRDARVHDARHKAATLLVEQGVHIRVVQEILGHTRVMTIKRYTHVATLQMKDASERMDEALWGQV
jgi:site-specific recombinase XerD